MSENFVTFSKEGKVGYLTLNRPPANSYEIVFVSHLDAAISAAEADDEVKVVIVRSASEKFFCAGADIKAFQENSSEANVEMIRRGHAALARMAKSPKVYIAAIAGHALGGGLEIALACDLRYAADKKFYLGLPEVNLGILPGNGGTQRLSRLIGPNKALEMMITGERVAPAEALALGIVNKVLPADEFEAGVKAYAEKVANGASMAIAHIKRCVYEGMDMELADGLEFEIDMIAPLFDSEDAQEGIAAFSEKRPADFKGK